MQKFNTLKSIPAYLPIVNIDTDMIIPKQFLKTIKRTGLGKNLFFEMRYDNDGNEIKDFTLNNEPFNNSKILIAGNNFGCGSSREHAVWAIYDKGFRVVVSSFFADIFKNNCLNIGVLPIQVTDSFLLEIFSRIEKDPDSVFEVNLENQEFIIAESGKKEKFKISVYKKSNMSNGFDDIDYLLNKKKEISKFANKSRY